MKVLLVEPEPTTAEPLIELLESAGYRPVVAHDGPSARALFERERPDLVLLDVVLPDGDGLVLCSDLRARWPGPIVLLSPGRRKSDPILGRRLGADEVIARPFDAQTLLARLEAVVRRSSAKRQPAPEKPAVERVGPLSVDVRGRAVLYGEDSIHLTPTEFRLLATLASDPERVFSREELATRIWGDPAISEGRLVDVHIRRLRQKLDEANVVDPAIVTRRGFGYTLSRVLGLSRPILDHAPVPEYQTEPLQLAGLAAAQLRDPGGEVVSEHGV